MTLGLPRSTTGRQAILVAMLLMAWQVAAKGTRDSLFLAAFRPVDLPGANAGAALCSVLLAVATARLLRRLGPGRVIPLASLLGVLLHAAEWLLLPSYPRAVAAFTYVHIIALGPVLLSGFWALASERFDPREARRQFGQITAFGTIGAVSGPLLAERVAQLRSTTDLLLFLAILQLAGSLVLLAFARGSHHESTPETPSLLEILSDAPYVVRLAAFILLITMSAATLDYLFKVQVYSAFTPGPSQARFFLFFNAVTAAVTFGVQAAVSRLWLRRFGPGRTVAALPVAVAGAGAVSMMLPGATSLIVSRALEQLLRGSLFRSGYELFYTPMPAAEKRAVKPVIDIGADRSGELLANAAIQLLLVLPAAVSFRVILGLTTALAGGAAWLAFRLDRAYVAVLEKGLRRQTVMIQPEEAEDLVTKSVVLSTLPGLSLAGHRTMHAAAETIPLDPVVARLAELRSRNPGRIRAALRGGPLEPMLVAQVIDLLGRDDVARPAHDALVKAAPHIAGQLVDYLSSSANDLKVRRRLPRILATAGNRIAWDGLLAGLDDERFEIRARCARSLEKMMQRNAGFQPDQEAIFAVIGRELSRTSKGPWPSAIARAGADASADQSGARASEVLRERASERFTLLATVLSLVLPPQSVRLAFRALQTDDAKLRGVALEYLDSVLPQTLRVPFAALFEGSHPQPGGAPARGAEALANLMDSSPSIIARLKDMGADLAEEEDEPPEGGAVPSRTTGQS